MTFREKLQQEHPDYSESEIADVCKFNCPSNYRYGKTLDCYYDDEIDCATCWDREMEKEN